MFTKEGRRMEDMEVERSNKRRQKKETERKKQYFLRTL